jgi:fatty-acyl-CoA synthase
MAALVLQPGVAFDAAAFFAFTARRLPPYALPLFVRVTPEADMTSTFKLRKLQLQEDGYDPTHVRDPLFVRDEARATYTVLTPEVHGRLSSWLADERRPAHPESSS